MAYKRKFGASAYRACSETTMSKAVEAINNKSLSLLAKRVRDPKFLTKPPHPTNNENRRTFNNGEPLLNDQLADKLNAYY